MKSDARSEGPDGSRTDLGFDADPILFEFSMLSAELDLLYIGHLKSKLVPNLFKRSRLHPWLPSRTNSRWPLL